MGTQWERKWGNWKGLREGWGLEKVEGICSRIKNCTFEMLQQVGCGE